MKSPLILPLFAYGFGILVGTFGDRYEQSWALVAVPVVIVIALLAFLALREKWTRSLLLVLLSFVGVLSVKVRLDPPCPPNHIVHFANGEPLLLEGTLYQDPQFGDHYTRLFFRCQMVRGPTGNRQTLGKAELFVPERLDHLRSGDVLILETRLRKPRNYGNPGESDLRRQSYLRGVYVRGSVADSFHILRIGHTSTLAIFETVAKIRFHLTDFFQKVQDPSAKGLLYGLILGDRSLVPPGVLESFRKTGLSHLLAIAGLHVGLVGLFVYGAIKTLLKRSLWVLLRWPVQKLAALASIPCLLCYVLVAGAPITAIRALLMALMFVCALMLSRVHIMYNAVALAALLILLFDPGALFSPAFQLSFASVLVILVLVPHLRASFFKRHHHNGKSATPLWKARLGRTFTELFCVSLAATLGTAPLIAYYFHQISLVSLLANLLIVPLVGWVGIPCALVASFLSFLNSGIASLLLQSSAWVLKGAVWLAGCLERIPQASIRVGSPKFSEILLYYLILFMWVWKSDYRWKRWCIRVGCVLLCISFVWAWVGPRMSRQLGVTFLSVGQGQSILIELPGGKRMLLDGGMAREDAYDAGERIVAPYLWSRRIVSIDYLVVSHGEADHYGGLGYIADNFRIKEVWTGPPMGDEEEGYVCFLALCQRKGILRRMLHAGLGPLTIQGSTIHILNPVLPQQRDDVASSVSRHENRNDRSLVFKLVYKESTFLFTGDIEGESERRLVGLYGDMIASTILNVPHHGSNTSSTEVFLAEVHPSAAIISAGFGNRYRFPSRAVVDRYEKMGIPLFRTDLDGAIDVRSDGRALVIQTFSGSKKGQVFRIGDTSQRHRQPMSQDSLGIDIW